MRTLLALALGAMLAMALASCEQILGLDDNLGPADTTADASADGGTQNGGGGDDDATAEGGGSNAGDASLVDGADGGGGGSDAQSNVWQLDRSYGNDGAAVLLSGSTDDQPDLELVYVGDAAALDAGVYAVGIAVDSNGVSVADFFNADQPGAAPDGTPVADAQGPATYRLLGAFPSAAGITAFAQDVDTLDVGSVTLTSAGSGYQADVPNASDVTISRLVQQDGDEAFAGPGTLGVIDDGDAKGVGVTVGATVSAALVDRDNDLLLAQGVATGSGTWFGGYGAYVPLSAVAIQRVDGGAESTLLSTGPYNDVSSVTDFAAAGTNLFAVGYVGSSFALWRMPADPDRGPSLLTPTGATGFVGGETCTSPGYFCFIRSAVADDGAIVVSGALGDPYLATFDSEGNEAKLLTPLDGGSPVSSLDVATLLPSLDGDGQWNAGTVLARGDYLYAAFASMGSNPSWAVVRLRRGSGP